MLEQYKKLIPLKCFSFEEASGLFGNNRRATNILYSLKKKGLIKQIKKNLYAVMSLETEEPVANYFEIASKIAKEGFVSYHSSLEYYGLANQVYSNVYVSTAEKNKVISFEDRDYLCLNRDCSFGISQIGLIRISDLERSVLDSIKDFEKIGGIEELLRCLDMVSFLDEEKLIDYLEQYNSRFLYQKTGYLLSFFPKIKLSSKFFDICLNHIGSSSRYLYSELQQELCVFDKKWNLCVPGNLFENLGLGY